MKHFIKRQLRKIRDFFDRISQPYPDEIVMHLIMGTIALELTRDEYIELAPLKGCCGPFQLSGNGLPVFEYVLFEKSLMEFVRVRVEIAKPDVIRFVTRIEAHKASSTTPERHGEEIETTEKYKRPFNELSLHLFRYFGHYVDPSKRGWMGSNCPKPIKRDNQAILERKALEAAILGQSALRMNPDGSFSDPGRI